MAVVFAAVKGKKLTKLIAENDGVQADLEIRTFAAAVRAETMLLEHRAEGHSAIEIDHGKVDWYVILSDERGEQAAMSIEYGRKPYEIQYKDGTIEERPGSDGLFILHRAFHLPKKGAKVALGRVRLLKRGR